MVSVLIVNFRTPELTIDAVRSAIEQPEATEILVVDNFSGDDSVERLRTEFAQESRVTLIAHPENVGFGRGNNLAAERATQPFLFLLNSDAMFHQGALKHLLSAWASLDRPGILAPMVYLKDGQTLQADAVGNFPTVKRILTREAARYPTHLNPDWVSGCAMLLRTEDYRAVGGFDPDIFMYYEDVLLCREIRRLGKEVYRCPEAGVTHLGGGSYASTWKKKKQYYDAQDVFLRKMGQPELGIALVRLLRWPHLALKQLRGRL